MDNFDYDQPDAQDGLWFTLGLSSRKTKKTMPLEGKKERKSLCGVKISLKKKDLTR